MDIWVDVWDRTSKSVLKTLWLFSEGYIDILRWNFLLPVLSPALKSYHPALRETSYSDGYYHSVSVLSSRHGRFFHYNFRVPQAFDCTHSPPDFKQGNFQRPLILLHCPCWYYRSPPPLMVGFSRSSRHHPPRKFKAALWSLPLFVSPGHRSVPETTSSMALTAQC